MSVQAIAGVSATSEAKIMTVVPSVAGLAAGRMIGLILDCIPINVFGMRISRLLFGLPLAPLGAILFLLTKGFGPRYVLTNRSVQIWNSSNSRRIAGADLSEIDAVELEQSPGQRFFRAADIRLVAASGKTLLRLSGVAEARTFRNAIQNAIQSRRQVGAALDMIAARQA